MVASTLITDYLNEGTGAPSVAPAVKSGTLAFYMDKSTGGLYAYNWLTPGWVGPFSTGGGGGGATAATVRGSGIQAASAGSFTVNWPAGTVAGDLAIIWQGGGFTLGSTPAGWTLLNTLTGFQSGSVIGKLLDSTDISTGHVILTMGGTFDSVVAITTFQGSCKVLGVACTETGSGSTAQTVSAAAYQASAGALYFGSNRGNVTTSCTQGTLLQTATTGSAASGAIFYGSPSGSFPATATFGYSAAGGGTYQGIVFVST